MARANWVTDVSKGVLGFEEGRVKVTECYSTMYQFPVNSRTGEQSAAFAATVIKGNRVGSDGKVVESAEEVEIVVRTGNVDENGHYGVRPGKLDAKDFDNTDVDAVDLGTELDVRGNSWVKDPGSKFFINWGVLCNGSSNYAPTNGLIPLGFNPQLLGRCVTTDLVGLDAEFKTVEGKKYTPTKGKNKGVEQVGHDLVITRIYTLPGDKPASAAGTGTGSKPTKVVPGSVAANVAASTATAPPADDFMAQAVIVFGALTPAFKTACPSGQAVPVADVRKELTRELMNRQKKNPKIATGVKQLCSNDEKLLELSMELVDKPGAFEFDADGKTVTFE